MVSFRTRLTEADFIKANLAMLYGRLYFRIFAYIVAFFLFFSLLTALFVRFDPQTLIVFILMLGFQPLITWFTARSNFRSNTRNGETIDYLFESNRLTVKGESFKTEISLAKIYKVTKSKRWLFIWQGKQIANVISRQDLTAGQLASIKDLLAENGVKNNL